MDMIWISSMMAMSFLLKSACVVPLPTYAEYHARVRMRTAPKKAEKVDIGERIKNKRRTFFHEIEQAENRGPN